MPRLKRDIFRFPRWQNASDELEAQKETKYHETPPTALDHSIAHMQVIDGWDGGTYVLPKPVNTLDGDSGQIALRGHASQTVTFTNYNYGATVPALSTNPAKMTIITWKRINGSFVCVSTGEKDWVY